MFIKNLDSNIRGHTVYEVILNIKLVYLKTLAEKIAKVIPDNPGYSDIKKCPQFGKCLNTK